jgi:hypothetical protein
MSMTITEKILARAAGKDCVKAGELVNANVDMIMCHDVTTPPAISMLKEKGIDKVFDPEKIVVTPDHFQPAKDIKSAELHKRLDTWAKYLWCFWRLFHGNRFNGPGRFDRHGRPLVQGAGVDEVYAERFVQQRRLQQGCDP